MRTAAPLIPLTAEQRATVAANINLARKVARRYREEGMSLGLDVDELDQVAALGLMRAAVLFDPGRGFQFSTYAWVSCQRHVFKALQIARRKLRVAVLSANQLGGDEGRGDFFDSMAGPDADPADVAEWAEEAAADAVGVALEELPARQRLVLTLRHGLNGAEPMTLEAVGRFMRVTKERVRQLEMLAVASLVRCRDRLQLAG